MLLAIGALGALYLLVPGIIFAIAAALSNAWVLLIEILRYQNWHAALSVKFAMSRNGIKVIKGSPSETRSRSSFKEPF